MKHVLLSIYITVAALALINGLLCFTKPSLAITLQQRFYEKINWKIEPIDLKKELRNTKIMGVLSICLALAATLIATLHK